MPKKSNRSSNKSKQTDRSNLSGEPLMLDALRRIEKISGKQAKALDSLKRTIDAMYSTKDDIKSVPQYDLAQQQDIAAPSTSMFMTEGGAIYSEIDYKIDKKLHTYEQQSSKIINDTKLSMLKWCIGIIIASIFASAGIMYAIHQTGYGDIKDQIKILDDKLLSVEKNIKYKIAGIEQALSRMKK